MESLIIIMVIVCVGALYFYGVSVISRQTKAMEEMLTQINGFEATQKVIGIDGDTGIAIDEQRKKVCLLDYRGQSLSVRIFPYRDLLSSEIFEDGTTITKTVRSSQIGGALLGGVLLGGVGAIIGGLTGKTETSPREIKRIDLRIIVNDTKNPIHDINFLNRKTEKKSPAYEEITQKIRHWHGLVTVMIKQADIDDKQKVADSNTSHSIADELKKLAELHANGVLTIEEFQQQKSRILGS